MNSRFLHRLPWLALVWAAFAHPATPELEAAAAPLAKLLQQKAYGKVIADYCPSTPADLRSWYPTEAEGLSDAEITRDIEDMRSPFRFDLVVVLKESTLHSGSWQYLMPFYGQYEEDDWGYVTLTFVSGNNRLDVSFAARLRGDTLMLMCFDQPGYDLLWDHRG